LEQNKEKFFFLCANKQSFILYKRERCRSLYFNVDCSQSKRRVCMYIYKSI